MVLHGLSWFPVKQVWQISIALCGSEECGGGGGGGGGCCECYNAITFSDVGDLSLPTVTPC